MLPVGGQSPSLAGIGIGLLILERFRIIDEGHLVCPGEDVEIVSQHHRAFGEILAAERQLLGHASGLKLHLAHCGFPELARAFVQLAVVEEQSLCVGTCVVGIFFDDLDAITLRPSGLAGEGQKEEQDRYPLDVLHL